MEEPYPQRRGRKTGPSSRDTFALNVDNQQAWFGKDVTPMGGCKACQDGHPKHSSLLIQDHM